MSAEKPQAYLEEDGETRWVCSCGYHWKTVDLATRCCPGRAKPTPDHYAILRDILDAAFRQAAQGKGKERHATDNAWADQPIGTIGRMVGPGFNSGQAIKKLTEAMGMLSRGERDAARREVLGAIVYAASVVMLIEGEG